jgi:hypothetical protein
MKINFKKFQGTLPYASELFGVYQPLLGWRSKRTKIRIDKEFLHNFSSVASIAKSRIDVRFSSSMHSQNGMISGLDSFITRDILTNNDRPLTDGQWEKILSNDAIEKHLKTLSKNLVLLRDGKEAGTISSHQSYLEQVASIYSNRLTDVKTSSAMMFFRNSAKSDLLNQEQQFNDYVIEKEKTSLLLMQWLAGHNTSLLNDLLFIKPKNDIDDLLKMSSPKSNFGETNIEAVLSPIGIIHLFRQYFFEFDTFLGPAVGHIWISPGGTVELIEISTRRIMTERTFESSLEETIKSESQTTVRDELADAVKEENKNDIKFGFSANAKYSNPFFEAGANTNLNIDSSRTTTRETAHKFMREQSEKLSSEIKRSFKSTFKVTSEQQDSSSKRYVIQNTTEQLVNYELRRKMRQIGVQVQDVNTQLCWQVFVDDPGKQLGISKLVHISQPADLAGLQPPTIPAPLPDKQVEITIQFPYENTPDSEGNEMDVTFYQGDDREGGVFSNNDKIVWKRTFKATPPAPGYVMSEHIDFQVNHSSIVGAEVVRNSIDGQFEIVLNEVNFDDQPNINFKINTYWNPPAQPGLMDEYNKKLGEYTIEKARKEKEAYVAAAQERVTHASKVKIRKFEDLREEERIVVYRRLIQELMQTPHSNDKHITSELLRSIFDVDSMLYFVAPEWWRSRIHQSTQSAGSAKPLMDDSIVSWGGAQEAGRDNYYITNDSDTSKLGSSLGWLMQLDGDNLRNAFLNSPWVKAVIPIRPGKEHDALIWLQSAHVEGTDGLDAKYAAPDEELLKIKPDGSPVSIKDALFYLADNIKKQQAYLSSPHPSPLNSETNILPTEIVYEHGFNPLEGGVRVNEDPFKVFSQWIETLPTDQVVALEYNPEDHL